MLIRNFNCVLTRTRILSPYHLRTFLHYSETSETSKSKFNDFPLNLSGNIYQQIFEKFCISEHLRGQRSAAGIFKKLKALDISLIIYQWKIFSSLISKKVAEGVGWIGMGRWIGPPLLLQNPQW